MTWLDTIVAAVDMARGRFEAFEARTEVDRQACLAILHRVRQEELNRVHGSSVLETAAFADRQVRDRLFATRDTKSGEVVGCIRWVDVTSLMDDASSRREYRLDAVPKEVLERSQAFTRLAILPEYRRSPASLCLFRELYQWSLERGLLASFQSCEPGLYQGYLRLGFRPLGPVHAGASGGFRIPMVCVHHDQEHFERTRSPMLRTLRAWKGERPEDAVRWFRVLQAERGAIDFGVAFYTLEPGDSTFEALTRNLSEPGRQELFKNSVEVECEPGDVIVREGDGGRFLGLVSDGVVEVRQKGNCIAILGRGELFGEVAVALDGYRMADLVAADQGTRVVTLSRASIRRLERPEDQVQIWRNIARVLAERLSHTV